MVALLIATGMLFSGPSPKKTFSFSGTVGYGEKFAKTLPNGFVFNLTPSDCGWIMNVHPADLNAQDQDYVWPENPPIRNKNQLFLDDEYDGDWELPLKHPHTIFFAKAAGQAKRQLAWIDAMDRGDYELAKKFDSPESAFGKLVFKVIAYHKQKVQQKIVADPKNSYCADDLSFRVTVSNF